MRRTLTIFTFVLLLSAGSALAQTFGAVLTGSQEVPPTTSQGFGTATVTFTDATHINVTINVANLGAAINNFHIHGPNGPAGTNASVIINLIGLGGVFTNGTMTGNFPIDAGTAAQLIAHPENFYVNVHTTQFPGGAVRGQLAPVSGTVVRLAADLRGSNEVPPNSSTAVGSALVTIDTASGTITWNVSSSLTNATLGHIHGPGGTPGNAVGVFVGFANPVNGKTSGSAVDAVKAAQIVANPNEFYVNLHSAAFPAGEIRGQLAPAKEVDVPVTGQVGTFVTDVRVFNPSFTTALNALVEYFAAGTTANTNATNTININVPPRGTGVMNSVNGSSLLNSGTGIGAVRVTSVNEMNVTSKIFSDQRSGGKGTFGQFLPGIPRANALRRGVLTQLANNADFRTNVGFFNPNNTAVTVRLELRDENSNVVATSVQNFQALSFQQNSIGTYFPGVDLSNKANLTLSFDAGAPIDVYAAVNDNVSTDSFVVTAQEDSGVASNQ